MNDLEPQNLTGTASAPLLEVVYESRRAPTASDDAIAVIGTEAKARNAADAISGLLILHGNSFTGVLEGPAEAVIATLERISNDPRNRRLVILREAPIETRRFADWSFHSITEAAWSAGGDWEGFARKLSRELRRNRPPQSAA